MSVLPNFLPQGLSGFPVPVAAIGDYLSSQTPLPSGKAAGLPPAKEMSG